MLSLLELHQKLGIILESMKSKQVELNVPVVITAAGREFADINLGVSSSHLGAVGKIHLIPVFDADKHEQECGDGTEGRP